MLREGKIVSVATQRGIALTAETLLGLARIQGLPLDRFCDFPYLLSRLPSIQCDLNTTRPVDQRTP